MFSINAINKTLGFIFFNNFFIIHKTYKEITNHHKNNYVYTPVKHNDFGIIPMI